MGDPVPELYCADCRQHLDAERVPLPAAGLPAPQWYVIGGVRCLTAGCLGPTGVLDREGNPVDVDALANQPRRI